MSADPFVQPSAVSPASAADKGLKRKDVVQSQLAGMLHGLARLADLQVAIWLSALKAVVLQVVCVAFLCILALLATIVAVLFLYAGVFHILTDYLHVPTAWALLVFAGVHGGLAGGFVMAAIWILNRQPAETTKPGDAR